MKKVLLATILMAIGFSGGLLWKDLTAQAAGGGGAPRGNGDVNGDGKIDLTDAVALLSWLFMSGKPPAQIECPPPEAKGLPATGQTKCYGILANGWTAVPCDQAAACPGQDGSYTKGCPSEGRFLDNGDATVTDDCTGLVWQKDTADVNGDGKIDDHDRVNWCDALAYCENLSFAGHDDWRLPNMRELLSILDYGLYNGAIDPVFGRVPDWYWSSTSDAALVSSAWVVDFSAAHTGSLSKDGGMRWVRAVRGP